MPIKDTGKWQFIVYSEVTRVITRLHSRYNAAIHKPLTAFNGSFIVCKARFSLGESKIMKAVSFYLGRIQKS